MKRICECCKKEFEVKKISQGRYSSKKYCSKKCRKIMVDKHTKETCLKRYGVINKTCLSDIKDKIKKTKLERYGDENFSNIEKAKKTCIERYGKAFYNNREKYKETCLKKYGVESTNELDSTKMKGKQTKLERYGDENYNNRDSSKETCLKKYGVNNYVETDEFQEKQRETKNKNKTWNTSKPEKEILKLLLLKFPDTKYQYKSNLYPFNCDFYIPELDLYIEYQGTWNHGKSSKEIFGPYDPTNDKHKRVLDIWYKRANEIKGETRYIDAIDVWTIKDPLKRKTAKENNLNWLEFFTMEEFMTWYNSL